MGSQADDTSESFDREAALRLYKQRVAEKRALAMQLAWLRAQLGAATDTDSKTGSDLLFLAEYAKSQRHFAVRCTKNDAEAGTGGSAVELTVQQRMEKMSTVLWPSGCVLAEVVAQELGELCSRGSAILELGCGTAVPSIVAAALGAQAVATDADVASAEFVILQNQKAVAEGGSGSVATAKLVWGGAVPEKPWAAVIIADAIYDEEGHDALATTLASAAPVALAAGATEPPRILLAYQIRRPAIEERFFNVSLPKIGLKHRDLPLANLKLSDALRSCVRVVDLVSEHSVISEASTVDTGSGVFL